MLLKKHRVITAVLALSMTVTLLTGCNSAPKDTDNKQGTTQSQQTQAEATQATEKEDPYAQYVPKADKVYEISWTTFQNSPVDDDPYIVDIFNEMYNVKIDIWNIDNKKYDEILNLKLASGEVPDFIRTQSLNRLQAYYDQDLIMEIPEGVIERFAPNLYQEYLENDPDFFKKYGKVDGKLYAINQLKPENAQRMSTVYRGDWMAKVGVTKTPDTLEEFEQLMYKFANEDPDGNNKKDTYGLSNTGMQVVFGAFGYMPMQLSDFSPKHNVWRERDGKLVYSSVQPEMKDALSMLAKWYKDGIIDPEFITGEKQGTIKSYSFITGRIGFTGDGGFNNWHPPLAGRSEVAVCYDELKKLNANAADALIYGIPPAGPEGKRGQYKDSEVTTVLYTFGKHLEKEPDKLGKILQVVDGICFESYENIMTAWFGIKGQDWDYNEFGLGDSLKENWKPAEASKEGGHTQLYALKSKKRKLPESVDQWLNANRYYEFGIESQLFDIQPSAGQYQAELDKIEQEAYISIIVGDKPVDYFDEFVDKWYKAGGSILEQEANK